MKRPRHPATAIIVFALFLTCSTTARAEEQPAPPSAPAGAEQSAHAKRSPKLLGAGVPEFTPMAGETTKNTMYLLAVLLIGLSLYKKFKMPKGGAHASDAIELTARKSIGPRTSLLLVTTEGKKLLLAQSGDTVSLISVLDATPVFDDTFTRLAAFDDAADDSSLHSHTPQLAVG